MKEEETNLSANTQDKEETKPEARLNEEVGQASAKKEVKEMPAGNSEEVEVPAKFKKIVEEIEKMPVLELNELVKVFEKKFGVSASAVAAAIPGAGTGASEDVKSTFDAELTDGGATKIAVIKVVKEVLGLGLKEAKDLVDGAPTMLKTEMKKEDAEELKKKIEGAGGKVTLK